MTRKPINRHYVSPIDLKLAEFDQTHAKSASQLREIKKYEAIYQRRDFATTPAVKEKFFWE